MVGVERERVHTHVFVYTYVDVGIRARTHTHTQTHKHRRLRYAGKITGLYPGDAIEAMKVHTTHDSKHTSKHVYYTRALNTRVRLIYLYVEYTCI